VVLNPGCAAYFKGWRVKTQVIPNAVEPPQHAELPERAREILAAGRLVPLKGFDLLIRAFHLARTRLEGWNVVLLGQGEARADLESLVAELGLEGRVVIRDAVRDPGEVMRRAAVFVLSSRVEGFPNVLCEAMAHGMAVIAADCETGPRDIITPGEDGLLIPADNVEALAKALVELAENPDRRASLGRRATSIIDRYSLEAIHREWAALLDGVRPGPGSGRDFRGPLGRPPA
jgi:glycosyltransferase involved in cell wall biosynthesis